ncbi:MULTISPECIES: hypothetical protein [Vibrio]|uniref:hypothetical protein n=1 Tax=Vibrio TaxID=662 RepID=UPI000769E903|nr:MULTISPECIES: hypothetical protein [Vibrio]
MNSKLKYFAWAFGSILPVLLTWALGLLKLPDSVHYLDYVENSWLVLDTEEKLTSDIEVLVKSEKITKLSTYSISFINETGKHFDKIKIEFNLVKGSDTKLLSSSLEGPEDYSISSMRKIEERDSLLVYEFDYLDRASELDRNYYTLNLLFSGPPPKEVRPIGIAKGLKLRPKVDNPKDKLIMLVTGISVVFVYLVLLALMLKSGDKSFKKKQDAYKSKLTEYLINSKGFANEEVSSMVEDIVAIRKASFTSPNFIKRYIRKVTEKP